MSNKESPPLNEIDKLLLDDGLADMSTTDLPKIILSEPIANVRAIDKVARLNHRISHVNGTLTGALESASDWREQLENDLLCCDEFTQDMSHWDAVLKDLEAATASLTRPLPAEPRLNNDSPEAIADSIATELDEEFQAVADEDEMFSNLLDIKDEMTGVIGDEDVTINRDQHELLLTLVAQESRIRELEERLQRLNSQDTGRTATGSPPAAAASEAPYVNRVIVAMNSNENLKYGLTDNIMTIGREPHNDIHIRSRYISRFHARIISDSQGSTIEDLDSRNGIAVNSQKVQRKQLRSGDLIDFGRLQFKFIDLMEGSSDEGRA